MPLRVRLFIYIALVFLIIMISSFFIEEYLIDRSLIKTRTDLNTKIEQFHQTRLQNLESYVKEVLVGYRTKINALLSLVKDYPAVRLNFDPDLEVNSKKTWLDSSTLITNNKWIDIVQNVKNGKIASSMLIDNHYMPKIQLHELFPNIKIVIVSLGNKPTPLVAVQWKMGEVFSSPTHVIYKNAEEDIANFYVLFKPETILGFDLDHMHMEGLFLDINPLYPFLKWIEAPSKISIMEGFLDNLKQVQEALKEHEYLFLDKEMLKLKIPQKDKPVIASDKHSDLDLVINRYEQIGLLWGYTTLIASGAFGNNPFDPNAPVGLIRTAEGSDIGTLLLRHRVFFKNSSLDNRDDKSEPLDLENMLSVILFKNRKDRCCFGNTLRLMNQYGVSDLTIGIDADNVFKELALATSKDILFISNNQIVTMFNSSGFREAKKDVSQVEIQDLLSKSYGFVPYKGERYFFLHVVPFKDQDFHFFILSPESEEFFFIEQLSKDLKWLAGRIGWQVACAAIGAFVILLFLLARISNNITKPLVALAGAAERVKEGHFDDAFNIDQIRKMPPQDEVKMLYAAFYDMVNGLKEKEKVRSILNKVVSTAIANEILKKELYLGGEEKDVTMFFSDIRTFTSMTENMKPQDVISMLNTCMTKVSKVIDDHGGVIDKYVGDEVMALFGAPVDLGGSALRAVLCAIEVVSVLQAWNKERETSTEKKIEMGIGIHKGKVFIGNMGAQNRLNYTVLGSNVNLASRLCSKAKPSEILISKEVYEEILADGNIEAEAMEPIELKGFSHKIEVYRVLGYKKKV